MWKELRVPFLTILFSLFSLFVFTKIFGPIPFSVNSIQTTKEGLFTASGQGEATAVPNTAQINLGVSKNAPTIESAQQQVNTIINQITEDLLELGVEEESIKTNNYSVNPEYDFPDGRQTPRGYSVNATLIVKIESVERANQAIDIATRAGATQVGGIEFVLNDDERREVENEARKIAIDNAKEKAESIAKAAGIRLGRIVDVQESGSDKVPPVMPLDLRANEQGGDVAQTTELNPGENKVVVTVTLSYETL